MHLTISQPGQPTQHLPLADASLHIGELLLHPETGRVRYALPGGAPAVLLPVKPCRGKAYSWPCPCRDFTSNGRNASLPIRAR